MVSHSSSPFRVLEFMMQSLGFRIKDLRIDGSEFKAGHGMDPVKAL
jgi:hypothetical protein